VNAKAWKRCTKHLTATGTASKAWYAGVVQLLNEARDRDGARYVTSFVAEQAALLRQDTVAWAMVGPVLMNSKPKYVIDWMSDWAERKDVEPWMISNLGTTYDIVDRYAEAAVVRRAALAMPADHTTLLIQLLLVADEIILGNWEAAEQLLQTCEASSEQLATLSTYYQQSLNTCRAAIDLRNWWSTRPGWIHTWIGLHRFLKATSAASLLRDRFSTQRDIYIQCAAALIRPRSRFANFIYRLII
jgi:hypothetical protein